MAKAKQKELRHVAGGLTFYLKKLPAGPFLMALSESDKPVPPAVKVKYADGSEGTEINRNDRKYLRSLALWQSNYNARLFRLCVTRGISRVVHADGTPANPPEDTVEEIRFMYGDMPPAIAKYYWYADVIGNTAAGFMNLVMGQSEIIEEELKKDERRFRSSSKGTGVHRESDGLPSDSEMGGSVSDGTGEA